MTRRWREVAGLLLAVVLVGCAPALREPPTIAELAGVAHGASRDVDAEALLASAEAAFATRELDAVRRAADAWLRAAASDESVTVDALVGASHARVWLAEHETDADARERAAVSAVHAAQQCRAQRPDHAACTFWLAVALGVQARERRYTALDALPRIVSLLEEAAELDELLEHAGPARVLALVLVRAPGWPTGPGDPDLALEHARRAVELAPDYPPNQFCLAETLEAVGQANEAAQVRALAEARAREWLRSGIPQAQEWLD